MFRYKLLSRDLVFGVWDLMIKYIVRIIEFVRGLVRRD